MTNALWFTVVGTLLLVLGLSRPIINRLPITSAMIYLTVGAILGPMGFSFFHFNPLKESALLEVLTEVAVLISLFAAGLKMPVPFSLRRWRAPIQLAFVSMSITVGAVTLISYYFLQLPLGAAILLGAIVAPTDPVLATDVQSRHPGDKDSLRFTITSEAGMNDGSAFPFVMLGLGLLGAQHKEFEGISWFFHDVLWATSAGVLIGVLSGTVLAKITCQFRKTSGLSDGLLHDFLGLGLIATVYGLSLILHAWGFLAVFCAAVALRQTELNIAGAHNKSRSLTNKRLHVTSSQEIPKESTVSAASLIFKEHLERLSEVVLILLVGGMLFIDSWSYKAVLFSLFLFFAVRPLSVMLGLIGTDTPLRVRVLISWFGVRGIGSLYYLMYAIAHGMQEEISMQLIHITLVVIILSIFLHGLTVKPILNRF